MYMYVYIHLHILYAHVHVYMYIYMYYNYAYVYMYTYAYAHVNLYNTILYVPIAFEGGYFCTQAIAMWCMKNFFYLHAFYVESP